MTEFGDVPAFGAVLEELFAGHEVPTRLHAAIRRSHADGIPMNKLARELEASLADEDADEPTDVIPVAREERARRAPLRPLAIFAVLVPLLAGAALAAVFVTRHGGGGTKAAAGPPPAVQLHAAAAYDPPPGDGQEQDRLVGLATDGNPTTAWQTEHYASQSFGNLKKGVGLVLDAGSPVKLSGVTVVSELPPLDNEPGPGRPGARERSRGGPLTVTIRAWRRVSGSS